MNHRKIDLKEVVTPLQGEQKEISKGSSDGKPKTFFLSKQVRGSKKLTPQQVILALCRAKNWRLSDLAREIGYTRQSLNHYLHGFWEIPTRVKIKIAEALEVDSAVIWDLGVENDE